MASEWSVRIKFRGRDIWFNTHRSDRLVAAEKARDIWLSLTAQGLDATLKAFKEPMAPTKPAVTVGAYIEAAEAVLQVKPKTLNNYGYALRWLAAGSMGIEGPSNRSSKAGAAVWRSQVDSVRLADMTPDRVRKWIKRFVAAGQTPLEQAPKRSSANSYLRNGRAIFSPSKVLRYLDLELPERLPLTGVELEVEPDHRYRSEVNPELIITAGRRELSPDEYTVLLMALLCGLRKLEIDRLMWSQIRIADRLVRIERTPYFEPKSEKSVGDVPMAQGLAGHLRARMEAAQGVFVIPGEPMRADPTGRWYRCEVIFRSLNRWLRSKGVTAPKPLHSMRKEFGSLVAERYGIFSASTLLRHADIQTTQRHYVEHRGHIELELGKLIQ